MKFRLPEEPDPELGVPQLRADKCPIYCGEKLAEEILELLSELGDTLIRVVSSTPSMHNGDVVLPDRRELMLAEWRGLLLNEKGVGGFSGRQYGDSDFEVSKVKGWLSLPDKKLVSGRSWPRKELGNNFLLPSIRHGEGSRNEAFSFRLLLETILCMDEPFNWSTDPKHMVE